MSTAHASALGAYLPFDRRLAMARGVPMAAEQTGTALFADIAGFTDLTREVADTLGSREGADVLTEALERLFAATTDPVAAAGGTVVELLGDAFIAWFPGETASLAVDTARAMRRSIAGLEPVTIGTGTRSMRIKIGIGSGAGLRLGFGDPELMRYESLSGGAVQRALACESRCGDGEIVVDVGVLAGAGLVSAAVRSSERGPVFVLPADDPPHLRTRPAPGPDAPVTDIEALAAVPAPIRSAAAAGLITPDLRHAVTVFMAFDGVDPDGDGARQLDAVVRWSQSVVAARDGVVVHVGAGDKGTHLMAAFGAPVSSDHAAEQAVATAEELLAAGSVFDQVRAVGIGVAAGTVFSGSYGGSTRRTYGLIGSSVNMAARLMHAAQPNEVLVAAELAGSLAQRHAFDEPQLHRLKGFRHRVPVRRLRPGQVSAARSVADRSATRLIGRGGEMAAVQALLARRAIAVVVGEPGSGKSRMLAELLRAAARRQTPALVGAADVTERLAPYHAFRSVFRRILAVEEPVALDRLTAQVAGLLPDRPDLVAHTCELTVVVPMEVTVGPPPGADDTAERTLELLVEIIGRAVARAPLPLLALDDAQWFDTSTWRLVAALRARLPYLQILLGARPGYRPPAELDVDEIRLGPLGGGHAMALAAEVLGATALDDALGELIRVKAGGQPLFVVELAAALSSSAAVAVVAGRARLLVDAGAVPDSLREVIHRRVDVLAPSVQAVLRAASVLGRSGSLAALAAVTAGTGIDLPAALEDLRSGALIEIGHDRWELRHAVIGDVVYDAMPRRERRPLHEAVAHHLQLRDDLAGPAVVAHHFEAAGCIDEAVSCLLEAAGASIQAAGYPEASVLVERGLALLAGRADPVAVRVRIQLLATRGSVQIVTHGQGSPEVLMTYDAALALCEQVEATPDLMGVLFGLGAHYMFGGRLATAQGLAERCLRLSTGLGAVEGEQNAHMLLANLALWRADFAVTDAHAAQVLRRHRPGTRAGAGAPRLARFAQHPLVTVAISTAVAHTMRARPQAALRVVAEGRALAESLDHPYSIATAWQTEAIVLQELRCYAEALAAAGRLHELSVEHGFGPYIVLAQMFIGVVRTHTVSAETGAATLRDALHSWRGAGSALGLSFGYCRLAEALLLAGRVEEALGVVETALAEDFPTEELLYRPELLRVAAQAGSRGGADLLAQARDLAVGSGAVLLELRAATAIRLTEPGDAASAALRSVLARVAHSPGTSGLRDVIEARSALAGSALAGSALAGSALAGSDHGEPGRATKGIDTVPRM